MLVGIKSNRQSKCQHPSSGEQGPQVAEGYEQSLQLINKDSFITSLKSDKSQKLI